MSSNWREVVREQTEHPPPGAQQRVWRALHEPTAVPRRAAWRWAAAGALACAALVLVAWPRGETKTWATAGSVVSLQGAQAQFDPTRNQLVLREGTVVVSVWAEPALQLDVRGHHVEVEAAELLVRASGDELLIAPTQGWVLVDGARVEASAATRLQAGVGVQSLARALPADVATLRAQRQAELAVIAHQWEDAARALDEVGRSQTLVAEAAVLRKGELELRQLHDASRALRTFEDAARRYPNGGLAQERELSALEAEASLGQWEAVRARAARFLADHPSSERVVEVRAVLASAQQQLDARDAGPQTPESVGEKIP